MLSFRTLTRSAPRALTRAATTSMRQSAFRPAALTKTTAITSALRPMTARAAFSTTVSRRAADGETDDELSAKLESEIQVEEEMSATQQQPSSIKDFIDNSPFDLVDTPGEETVRLVRNFGDEKITVSFSIADVTSYDPLSEDPALDDAEELDDALDKQDGRKASEEQPDEEFDEEAEEDDSTPISLSIIIEKPGKSGAALTVDATAQEGAITVENVFYYDDAKVARIDTPDAAQRRADVYPGPPFGSLDEDLQVLMERFLEERGITPALAVFIPDYVDVKEQAEYMRWLNNVKGFVDA